jgi:hypothetical protein
MRRARAQLPRQKPPTTTNRRSLACARAHSRRSMRMGDAVALTDILRSVRVRIRSGRCPGDDGARRDGSSRHSKPHRLGQQLALTSSALQARAPLAKLAREPRYRRWRAGVDPALR